MALNISLQKKKNAPSQNPFKNSSPYDYQMGFWGVVTEVHPEDCTVHVRTNLGFELSGVRVASKEWVTVVDGKHLTGERHLPPVDTYAKRRVFERVCFVFRIHKAGSSTRGF